MNIFWTEQEIQIIKNNIDKLTIPQILKLLPNRTLRGLYAKCNKLNLHRADGIKLPISNTYNQEYFKELDLVKSFWAGCISADGCIFINQNNTYVFSYKVSVKDEIIIDRIAKEFNFIGKKQYSTGVSPHSDNVSTFVNIVMNCFDKNARYLEHYYNLKPHKTMRLGPTNLTNPYLNWAFIIGNIDGDGTIATKTTKPKRKSNKIYSSIYLHFCSASPHIIRWIKKLMDESFPTHLYSNKVSEAEIGYHNQDSYYRYNLNGLRAAVIIDYLSQFPVPMLERKWRNEKVWEFINKKKLEYPHLFKKLNFDEIKDLLPKKENNLSHSPNSPVKDIEITN